MIEIKEISTQRFVLRKVTLNDNKSIFEILSDEETTRYLNMEKVETVSDADAIIADYLSQYEKGDKFPFAIIDKETGEFVGVFLIKLDLFDPDCFEFTVYIRRELWNRGIYSEVLPYMAEFAFEKIGTGNFRGFIMISNRASAAVLMKNGFALEKTFKVDGLPEMIESYLMTKKDYEEYKIKNNTVRASDCPV